MILNITPDHLDRHGTFENYALAKERIFAVQDASDFVVLNADNPRAAEAASHAKAQVFWFSARHSVAQGAWVEDGNVVYLRVPGAATETVLPVAKIPLKGEHNVENVLAAACAARLAGVAPDRSLAPLRSSRPSSIAWNMLPPSTASSITTTPKPRMWTRPRRP